MNKLMLNKRANKKEKNPFDDDGDYGGSGDGNGDFLNK